MHSARLLLAVAVSLLAQAQVSVADYQRAQGLREKYRNLTVNLAGPATWIDSTDRFWYRKTVKGGAEFVIVDALTLDKRPAFDHARLAASLSAASGEKLTALALPFQELAFKDQEKAIEVHLAGSIWRCGLEQYACAKLGPIAVGVPGGSSRPPSDDSTNPPGESPNDVEDGVTLPSPQPGAQPLTSGDSAPERASPDGRWEVLIRNYNVFLRAKGMTESSPLSQDGSESNHYTLSSIAWSPDSKHLAAYRVRPGYKREVHYIESSPSDQLQPKHTSREYAKPGDAVDIAQPVLFDIDPKREIEIGNSLFPNPYSLSRAVWWKDSRGFTFEYNQRGHQLYRVISVDASTGKARALIDEESKTFIGYRPLVPNIHDTGKRFRAGLNDGREIVWASERDGWEHLYLYDGVTGQVKNQITKGDWVVRSVDKIDEEKRQLWFEAGGMDPAEDPYFVHSYRIDFDGTHLICITPEAADHTVRYSSDMRFYVDTRSRVDLPTVSELHRAGDRKLLLEIERADIQPLRGAGWNPPEVFSAPGRDGQTGIWGVIYKPAHFDPAKKYPVVEAIYAGPQGSFVPKTFGILTQPLTELGFVVAQIDGMGTNNRSKAFHDVAWHNLADAGFLDRILWHKAVAARYPWYDITRVGIFGTSAGGQNAMAALLFHPEFYSAAVANSGCHDNRMDKIWWNEQWMGWPVGPQYSASSNVDNAHLLQGKLLLVVGEMDTNVDPSSTLQVVNALIKADKRFDLLVVPGGGHGAGGAYGERLLEDFFVHNLLNAEPPDWNRQPLNSAESGSR